jgi:hypothetical protein
LLPGFIDPASATAALLRVKAVTPLTLVLSCVRFLHRAFAHCRRWLVDRHVISRVRVPGRCQQGKFCEP